jgi:[acyl-carrier-protein] S-malonyltransferase
VEGPPSAVLTENAQPGWSRSHCCDTGAQAAGVDLKRDAAFAGHSVGEYSALAAAGALTLADAVRLVRIRGRAMQQAVPVGVGAMAAWIGAEFEQAVAIARRRAGGRAGSEHNGGGQVVVSGHKVRLSARSRSRRRKACGGP